MEHFGASFREPWFTKTGEVRAQKGYKILYESEIPPEFIKEGYFLPVWIIANVQETDEDQVWLSDVEVLNEFMDTESKELVDAHAADIANTVQGKKAIRLTRNEYWYMFPQGTEIEVKNYISRHSQEALKVALCVYQEILPFPKLLELLRLPPTYRMAHLPYFISHQWSVYPEQLLASLKAISPAATVDPSSVRTLSQLHALR